MDLSQISFGEITPQLRVNTAFREFKFPLKWSNTQISHSEQVSPVDMQENTTELNGNNTDTHPHHSAENSPKLEKKTFSWADIVSRNEGAVKAPEIATFSETNIQADTPKSQNSPTAVSPIKFLSGFSFKYKGKPLVPKGLINTGNLCFLNTILQPAIHCIPFYNMIVYLAKRLPHSTRSQYPLLDSLMQFAAEFTVQEPKQKLSLNQSDAFAPEYVYDALRSSRKIDFQIGRQEDAEEFYGFIIDGLHEEFRKLLHEDDKVVSPANSDSTDSQGDWLEVGPKNKTIITRKLEVEETPISRLFGGRIRSVVKCHGAKDSVTLEPLYTFPLDITPDDVHSVSDALKKLAEPEVIEGFSTGSRTMNATKQNLIDTLPPVLVLQLKRFVYDSNQNTTLKVQKHISYPLTLVIEPQILATQKRSKTREYELFAVTYHHGKLAAGGHYTCDVKRANGEWLHFDDDQIELTKEANVISETSDRQAYLLFYLIKV